MDCEKFDQHVIDALYDELDELTHAALRRHVEGCSRCAGAYAGLRATREVGILHLVQPPDDLEARILDAVALAQKRTPWHKKLLRGLAWAGSHAMRPQLAMAALFFLVIGSSLLLLRARPGSLGPVRVTENGAPAPEVEATAAAVAGQARAAAAAAPAEIDAPAATAAPAAESARERSAAKAEDTQDVSNSLPKDKASADDARAALDEARTTREQSGCSAAVAKFDSIAVRFAGTQAAADAMWDEASCYKQMGETQKAQQLYIALRSTGYRGRAEQELAASDNNLGNGQNRLATRAHAAAAPPPAPPAASAPAAASVAAAKAAPSGDLKADLESPNAAGVSNGKASPKRPAAAAPNPRAPAAPMPRATDHATGFAP